MKKFEPVKSKWKKFQSRGETYEEYFTSLLDVETISTEQKLISKNKVEETQTFNFKLNKEYINHSEADFVDLVRWTLAQAVCYQIINQEYSSIRQNLRSDLEKIAVRYQKLTSGFKLKYDAIKLQSALADVDYQFASTMEHSNFIDLNSLDLKNVNLLFVEQFLSQSTFKDQRKVLKSKYIHSLWLVRESFYCKFDSEAEAKFKAFLKNEIYPNKGLSDFLKEAKIKNSEDFKAASEEDKKYIIEEDSFDLFHKSILKTLQRHTTKNFTVINDKQLKK